MMTLAITASATDHGVAIISASNCLADNPESVLGAVTSAGMNLSTVSGDDWVTSSPMMLYPPSLSFPERVEPNLPEDPMISIDLSVESATIFPMGDFAL